MTTSAWFDIATTQNKTIKDAKIDDILVRCLSKQQDFVFGCSGEFATFVISPSTGNVRVTRSLMTPSISTNELNPIGPESIISIGPKLKVDALVGAITLSSINTLNLVAQSNISSQTLTVMDHMKVGGYIETPHFFTSQINPYVVGNPVEMNGSLVVCGSISTDQPISSKSVTVTNSIQGSNGIFLSSIVTPRLITGSLDIPSDLAVTKLGPKISVSKDGDIVGEGNMSFVKGVFSNSIYAVNVNADCLITQNTIKTPKIVGINESKIVMIEGVKVEQGSVQCDSLKTTSSVECAGSVNVSGQATFTSDINALKNLIVNDSLKVTNLVKSSIVETPKLFADTISPLSQNSSILIGGKGEIRAVNLIASSLVSTKQIIAESISSSVQCNLASLSVNSASVKTLESQSISCSRIIPSTSSSSSSSTSDSKVWISSCSFEGSNMCVNGVSSLSSVTIGSNLSVSSDAKCIIESMCLEAKGNLAVSGYLTCDKSIAVPLINVNNIRSKIGNTLTLQSGVLVNGSDLSAANLSSTSLTVSQSSDFSGTFRVREAIQADKDIRCSSSICTNAIKGYSVGGRINIEGIQVTNYNSMTLSNLIATSSIVSPSFSLTSGGVIKNTNGLVLMSDRGATRTDAASVTTLSLSNKCVTNDKLSAASVKTENLDHNLTLEGSTGVLGSLFVRDGIKTANVSGLKIDEGGFIGLGGSYPLIDRSIPLNVLGGASFEDTFGSTMIMSGGEVNLLSKTDKQNPNVTFKFADTKATMGLASVDGAFHIDSSKVGDFVIGGDGFAGNILIMKNSLVISNNNVKVGVPVALPTLFASDAVRIGVDGSTTTNAALSMKGSLEINAGFNQIDASMDLGGFMIKKSMVDSCCVDIANHDGGDISIGSSQALLFIGKSGSFGFGTNQPESTLHVQSNHLYDSTITVSHPLSSSIKTCSSKATYAQGIFNGVDFQSSLCRKISFTYLDSELTFMREGFSDPSFVMGLSRTVQIGPYTKVMFYSEQLYEGIIILEKSNHSGETLNVNIPLATRSILMRTTGSNIHLVDSSWAIKSHWLPDKPAFYFDLDRSSLGVCTESPMACIDVNGVGSDMFAIRGVPFIDQDINMTNIGSISMRGPLKINGKIFIDSNNALTDISNVLFSGALVRSGECIVDNQGNMTAHKSLNVMGAFLVQGKQFFDPNSMDMTNIRSLSISGSLSVNGVQIYDPNGTLQCVSTISPSIQTSIISSLPTVNTLSFRPKDKLEVVGQHSGQVPTFIVNVTTSRIDMNGDIWKDGFLLIDTLQNLNNVNNISMNGSLYVGNKQIMDANRNINVNNMTIVRGGSLFIESANNTTPLKIFNGEDMSLCNIGSAYVKALIVGPTSSLIDLTHNTYGIDETGSSKVRCMNVMETIKVGLLNVTQSAITSPSSLLIKVNDGFDFQIGESKIMGCHGMVSTTSSSSTSTSTSSSFPSKIVMYRDLDVPSCMIQKISNTSYDNDLLIETKPGFSVATNIALKAPMFLLGEQSQIMSTSTAGGITFVDKKSQKILASFGTDQVCLNAPKLLINNPSETGYELCVKGSIYAEEDIVSFSDKRKKKDIRKISYPLERLSRIDGVTFTKVGQVKRQTGVIAQQVLRVLPEAVVCDPGSGFLGVAYGNLLGLVIESIKALDRKLDNFVRIKKNKRIGNIKRRKRMLSHVLPLPCQLKTEES